MILVKFQQRRVASHCCQPNQDDRKRRNSCVFEHRNNTKISIMPNRLNILTLHSSLLKENNRRKQVVAKRSRTWCETKFLGPYEYPCHSLWTTLWPQAYASYMFGTANLPFKAYWLCNAQTGLTIKDFTFCPHCIYVFCIYLRTSSDVCSIQHKLILFYNRYKNCLQRGTNWAFK
jgi:hypothetical protein